MTRSILILLFALTGYFATAQNYDHILNYANNGTPTHGVKIKTNIPFSSSTHMPTVKINGYAYGLNKTININLSWYVLGNFHNPVASSAGGFAPKVKIADENGKVVLFIDENIYFLRFTVSAYDHGISAQASWYAGWSAHDEALTSSNQFDFVYNNHVKGELKVEGTLPVLIFDDTDANNVTELSSYLSFRTQGTERGYVGFGSSTTDELHLVNQSGRIKVQGTDISMNGQTTFKGIPVFNSDFDKQARFVRSSGTVTSIEKDDQSIYFYNENNANVMTRFYDNGDFLVHKNAVINGKLEVSKIRVSTSPNLVPDYVFQPSYQLRTLSELENYVNTNSHLPNIPSAKEMAADGQDLGDLQLKLLEKIEELTLYTIDQEKQLKEKDSKIQKLETTLNSLIDRLEKLESKGKKH